MSFSCTKLYIFSDFSPATNELSSSLILPSSGLACKVCVFSSSGLTVGIGSISVADAGKFSAIVAKLFASSIACFYEILCVLDSSPGFSIIPGLS